MVEEEGEEEEDEDEEVGGWRLEVGGIVACLYCSMLCGFPAVAYVVSALFVFRGESASDVATESSLFARPVYLR